MVLTQKHWPAEVTFSQHFKQSSQCSAENGILFLIDTFLVQYKIASTSSQVNLAIQNNVNIIIFIALQKSKKNVQPSTFSKRVFFFPLMKASGAETDGQMLFE